MQRTKISLSFYCHQFDVCPWGEKKNIYISIFYPKCATCALFFLEELANIEKTGSNSAFSSRISWIEKNSWVEITDIDSGRTVVGGDYDDDEKG